MSPTDPYAVLGIGPQATDAELRAAYRHAVQREHPDHNDGSAESARRFEAVQEAYALIRVQRTRADPGAHQAPGPRGESGPPPGPAHADPGLDARLAELERQLAEARSARERIRRAAREAEVRAAARARRTSDASGGPGQRQARPSDEELGYYRTEDSVGRIISDAAADLFADVRRRDVPKRVADLIDELGAKLTGDPPER